MTKLRKQRRRKVYRHNVNRKRMRNKQNKKGTIECKPIKEAWDDRKSVKTNLQEMGLSYDPNQTLKVPSFRKKLRTQIIPEKGNWIVEDIEDKVELEKPKIHVAELLKEDANARRVKMFRLPKSQVEYITYLMDKYVDDYKAMARDKKNYYQETWKQIRAKVKRFCSIKEQYQEYLKKKGITDFTPKYILANSDDDSD